MLFFWVSVIDSASPSLLLSLQSNTFLSLFFSFFVGAAASGVSTSTFRVSYSRHECSMITDE